MKEFFTFKGRWNRLKFWIYNLALILPILWTIVFIWLFWYAQDAQKSYLMSEEKRLETYISIQETKWTTIENINDDPVVIEIKTNIEQTKNDLKESLLSFDSNSILKILLGIFWLIIYLVAIWISIIAYIKRLHDLDHSGWLVLMVFIPFINIGLIIYCGFFKWTPWENRFWSNPLGDIGWNTTQNWTPNTL
jgi:uncharacterized membrane protein YhaH (DUF805 family)